MQEVEKLTQDTESVTESSSHLWAHAAKKGRKTKRWLPPWQLKSMTISNTHLFLSKPLTTTRMSETDF